MRGNNFDFASHLYRQRAWSIETFGPHDRHLGVLDHIKKEIKEVEANPKDLSEHIDIVILGLDLALNQGYSPQEIIDALVAKQTKNEKRKWPDWRTAEPGKAIEHVREQE